MLYYHSIKQERWQTAMIEKRDIFFPPAGKLRRLHIHLPEDYY